MDGLHSLSPIGLCPECYGIGVIQSQATTRGDYCICPAGARLLDLQRREPAASGNATNKISLRERGRMEKR